MTIPLQPLRFAPGWRMDRNNFLEENPAGYFAVDPPPPDMRSGHSHYYGGAALLHATNPDRSRAVQLEWRTEPGQPAVGRYRLRLYATAVADPSEAEQPPTTSWADPLREFETEVRAEVVAELERWLWEVTTSWMNG